MYTRKTTVHFSTHATCNLRTQEARLLVSLQTHYNHNCQVEKNNIIYASMCEHAIIVRKHAIVVSAPAQEYCVSAQYYFCRFTSEAEPTYPVSRHINFSELFRPAYCTFTLVIVAVVGHNVLILLGVF